MRLIYHPDAEVELVEAAQFYERRLSTLGAQFLDPAGTHFLRDFRLPLPQLRIQLFSDGDLCHAPRRCNPQTAKRDRDTAESLCPARPFVIAGDHS